MKRIILKHYNLVISIFLTLLGFGGACMLNGCEYGTGMVEYGTPMATFKVSGTVSSEDNNKIPNIKVILEYDTSFTDINGKYEVETNSFPEPQNFKLEFSDIDGNENGHFQAADTTVSFLDPKFVNGDGSWYSGEASRQFDIKLKEEI